MTKLKAIFAILHRCLTPVYERKNCLKFSLSQKIITFCSPTQLFDVPLDPPLVYRNDQLWLIKYLVGI